ncbi:hypothetical protein AB0K81_31630 [Streptomyces werraensis]|uniref:DUF6895 domain-containing protein n=1 Tax=Streptomyces werraensis TaxID=68284 RepID=A0ABV3JNR3_9ACTN|nr:hypothetical protein [Streptomyces sp. GB4-14]GHF01518.1 hypothetical protein GCM10018789_33870 [Streptomyces werraensis]
MTALAEDLRTVADGALAWVDAHRAGFALGEDALAVDGEVDLSWKPLGELAQVCATVTRLTEPADPLHARARGLLDFAWQETHEGELFLRLQRLEPFATYPLEVYAALASAGLRHPAFEQAAAVVARTRGWRLTEQDPTRRLGVLRAEERCGVHSLGQAPPGLEQTWLGGLPEPWTFGRDAGYALTHVVFHCSDWGCDAAAVPPVLVAYLTDWLPPWLDTCLEAGMWDLGGELLAVAAVVARTTGEDPPADAWQRLVAARGPAGEVPLDDRDLGDLAAGPGDADGERYFLHHYHSTLMAAFAAVLAGARPDSPPARAAAGHRYGGQGAPA